MDLKLNGIESVILLSGKEVRIQKCSISFKKWQGASIQDSYGGKQVIDYLGEPLFSELVILRIMQNSGWQGVWVDGFRNKYRVGLPESSVPVALPKDQNAIIESIKTKNGGLRGCWDVYVWKSSNNMFIESKRLKKDSIQDSQRGWLQAALDLGFPLDSFLLVEWELSAE